MASKEQQRVGDEQDRRSGGSSVAPAVGQSASSSSTDVQSANLNGSDGLPRPRRFSGVNELVSDQHETSVRESLPDRAKALGFFSFRNKSQAKLEWLIDGLVYKGVTGMTGAFAKTGKTQVTMRMLTAMLTEEKFLNWTVNPRAKDEKILFLSLEMNNMEMNFMLEQMTDLDLIQHGVLEEQLMIECALSQNWQTKEGQNNIVDYVESTGATGLVVDALGSITKGSINEDTTVREVFDFISLLKQQLGCWIWLIHHTRKRTNEGKPHPPTIDDFYGSQYVAGRIRSSLALHKANDQGLLLVSTPANSLVKEVEPFYIQRTDELNFKPVNDKKPGWEPSIKLVDKVEDGGWSF